MAMNQSCYALVPKTSKHIFFYFMALKNSVSLIKGTSNSGVFDNIVTESFKLVKLYKPNFNLLEQFEANCKLLFERIENLLISGNLLLQSRDKLLSRLMSGKIDLENLDIQFPASMQEGE
jgi:type I restriction enzyme S subunit